MTHTLTAGNSKKYAISLMEMLAKHQSLAFDDLAPDKAAQYTLAPLFDEARGKMFGVLECLDSHGDTMVLKAFSGQLNGHWSIPGWSPPLFSEEIFKKTEYHIEKQIKQLTRQLQQVENDLSLRSELITKRKQMSQKLMVDLHGLYILRNFRGEEVSIREAFHHHGGIPTGAGDCCGPKLLNEAIVRGLTPVGMTEFFYGRENRSGSKQHGHFYGSCKEKCQPLLGYMLCGLKR